MKFNHKSKQEQQAVSAVIGVILMVAITVAIAATVYLYISGTIDEQKETTPNIAFFFSVDRLTVQRADNNLDWNDFLIKFDNGITTVLYNEVTGTSLNSGDEIATDDTAIIAGDYIYIDGIGTIQIVHTPTNSLMGIWTFT